MWGVMCNRCKRCNILNNPPNTHPTHQNTHTQHTSACFQSILQNRCCVAGWLFGIRNIYIIFFVEEKLVKKNTFNVKYIKIKTDIINISLFFVCFFCCCCVCPEKTTTIQSDNNKTGKKNTKLPMGFQFVI